MNWRSVVLVAGSLFLLSIPAQAGGLGLYGAYWSPKDVDAGYGGGAKIRMDLTSALGLEVRGTFFSDLSDDVQSGGTTINYDLEAIPAELGFVLNLNVADKGLRPYLCAGAGYYFLEINLDNPVGDNETIDLDDEVGWYGGGGIEIAFASETALFIEALYRGVEGTAKGDDLDEVVSNVDIDLSGIGANAGLLIKW